MKETKDSTRVNETAYISPAAFWRVEKVTPLSAGDKLPVPEVLL